MLQAKYRRRVRVERSHVHAKQHTNPITYSLYIGLYAGLIWGGLKLLEFALRFTEIVPGFLIEPFFQHAYLVTYTGLVLGYAVFIAFSAVAALLYGLLLRKLRGPYWGIGYGLAWWALLYLVVGPLTGMVPAITELDRNSLFSDLSVFVLWGLFIGYSIAYEFTEESERKNDLSRIF